MQKILNVLKRPAVSSALVMVCTLSLIFCPVLLKGKTLMMSVRATSSIMPYGASSTDAEPSLEWFRRGVDIAAGWTTEPWYKLIHRQYLQEHVAPLWNPYNSCGKPLAANMQCQGFFPLAFIAFLFPNPKGVDLFVLSRLFCAGWFTFMFLRLFLTGSAALVGALAFMFSGFCVLEMTMPEMSVVMMLPALLYAAEKLIRRPGKEQAALMAAFSALAILAGMPEETLLVESYAGAYFLFRLAAETNRSSRTRTFGLYVLSNILALCLSAPLLLLLFQYVHESFNIHDLNSVLPPGLGFCGSFWQSAMLYLLPLDYGALRHWSAGTPTNIYTYGYWGISATFLALIAVLASVAKPRLKRGRYALVTTLAIFLSMASSFFLLKRFGSPLVQWVGALPLFRLVYFEKYGEPVLAFSVASLAAIGSFYLVRKRVLINIPVAAFVLLGTIYALFAAHNYPGSGVHKLFACACPANIAIFAALLSGTFIVSATVLLTKRAFRARAVFLPMLVLLETAGLFMVPAFYLFRSLPAAKSDPYLGAPYVAFLQAHTLHHERVFAQDGVLSPEWSSAFALMDIRALDALYPRRYFRFVRNFVYGNPALPADYNNEFNLSNRFSGQEKSILRPEQIKTDRLLYRLFALTSVRHLAEVPQAAPPTSATREILQQNQSLISDSFRLRSLLDDGGNPVSVLFQHPRIGSEPQNHCFYKTLVDPAKPRLCFSTGMGNRMLFKPRCDGARFHIELIGGDGEKQEIFSRTLDKSLGRLSENWKTGSIDLSKWSGKTVILAFSTDSGAGGDSTFDYCGWKDIEWQPEDFFHPKPKSIVEARIKPKAAGAQNSSSVSPLSHDSQAIGAGDGRRQSGSSASGSSQHSCVTKEYDSLVTVYAIPATLPRAAFFSQVEIVKDGDQALVRLRDQSFNPFSEVAVEKDKLTGEELAECESINGVGSVEKCQPQLISDYTSQLVKIRVNATHKGLLMLNDTYYPGWNVYVDGKKRRCFPADYLFRGVVVAPGEHEVDFKYEPLPFRVGLVLAGLALVALFLLVGKNYIKASPQKIKEA